MTCQKKTCKYNHKISVLENGIFSYLSGKCEKWDVWFKHCVVELTEELEGRKWKYISGVEKWHLGTECKVEAFVFMRLLTAEKYIVKEKGLCLHSPCTYTEKADTTLGAASLTHRAAKSRCWLHGVQQTAWGTPILASELKRGTQQKMFKMENKPS